MNEVEATYSLIDNVRRVVEEMGFNICDHGDELLVIGVTLIQGSRVGMCHPGITFARVECVHDTSEQKQKLWVSSTSPRDEYGTPMHNTVCDLERLEGAILEAYGAWKSQLP
jgi:hypothetical protein